MQDIEIKHGSQGVITVCVLFNNGSEVTLVRNKLCKRARFKFQPATYTLVGVGGKAQTFTASNGRKVWSVVLTNNKGKTKVIKALGV